MDFQAYQPISDPCIDQIRFDINDSKINLRAFEFSLHFPAIIQKYRELMVNDKQQEKKVVEKNILDFKNYMNSIVEEAIQPELSYIQFVEEKEAKQKEINNILNEVIRTEEEYNKDMACYMQTYGKVLMKSRVVGELVRSSEVILLNIIALSDKVIKILKTTNYTELKNCLDGLNVYDGYFVFYEKIVDLMPKIQKELPQLQEIKSRLEMKNLGILDYLIKPVQRITKYPLFLKNLEKVIIDEEYLKLINTLDVRINEQLNKNNASQKYFASEREKENLLPLLKWKGTPLDLTTSLFIFKSVLSVVQIEKRNYVSLKEVNYGILFDHYILFGKSKGSRIIIEKVLKSVEIIEEFIDHIIVHSEETVFSLKFISKSDHTLWLNKLKEFKESTNTAANSFRSLSFVSSVGSVHAPKARRPVGGSFDVFEIKKIISAEQPQRTTSSFSNPPISIL